MNKTTTTTSAKEVKRDITKKLPKISSQQVSEAKMSRISVTPTREVETATLVSRGKTALLSANLTP